MPPSKAHWMRMPSADEQKRDIGRVLARALAAAEAFVVTELDRCGLVL